MKAETQKFIETFASYYTPSIVIIATLLVVIPTLFFGAAYNHWFEQAITILVITCPYSLVISTPISIYAAIGNFSAKGALVKGGKYIEAIGQIKSITIVAQMKRWYNR